MNGGFDGQVARGLQRIADLLAVEDGRPEQVRSFRLAATAVRGSGRGVRELVEAEGVEGVHRLGLAYELSGLVADFVRTGRFPMLERLEERERRRQSLQRVPGVGPRLEDELVRVLGVHGLDELADSVEDGRLARLCGFGPRRITLVREAISAMGVRPRHRVPVQLPLFER